MRKLYILVDGNYYYFQARTHQASQDFSKLEEAVKRELEAQLGPLEVQSKTFYTRPPSDTDIRAVGGWLRSHDWNVHVYRFEHTHQDSLYVTVTSDLWNIVARDRTAVIAVVSGSGALSYPARNFPYDLHLFTTEESCNRTLSCAPGVVIHDLRPLFKEVA